MFDPLLSRAAAISVDPGWGGAVVVRYTCGTIRGSKCPPTCGGIARFLSELESIPDCPILIEAVHAMPTDGVRQAWSFAQNVTSWRIAGMLLGYRLYSVSPQTWQKLYKPGLSKEKEVRKKEIHECATLDFPDSRVTLYAADAFAMMSVMQKFTTPEEIPNVKVETLLDEAAPPVQDDEASGGVLRRKRSVPKGRARKSKLRR